MEEHNETLEERVGLIHLYTGDAAGKTSAALGRALRALGHGHRVVMVQFLKGREDTGEYLIQDRLAPDYEVHQYGTEEFINLYAPSKKDKKLAKAGLKAIENVLETEPDVLILDEINLACAVGVVKTKDVVKLLKEKPKGTYVILTGREAPEELIDIADIATELYDLKERDCIAQEGIEY